MLKTDVCDVLGITSPIIQGALGGPWRASAQLIAVVSNAGGLGSIAATLRGPDDVRADIAEVRSLTDKPFAVNHTRRPFNEEAFQATLDERPPVISLALGKPSDLVERVHDIGSVFVQQVQTVQQGLQAAEAGVDVIIAQGGEGGGFSGMVGTIALVPQVVRAVSPIPVVAAGGIADGRGLAAALVLGAQGVNIGTRFLASTEAGISEDWKQAICAADSEDAVKIEFADHVVPDLTEGGWDAIPRSLRTSFIDAWNDRKEEASRQAGSLRDELTEAMAQGRAHELIPLTGQSAGLIDEVLPAAEIVDRLVREAEQALETVPH
jgi:nitronate monooxygenase/enoyl-[acyl-carrier protein] reductase II